MARSWSNTLGVWEGFHTLPDEYREVDHERVLALHRFSGKGKGSGLDLGPMGLEGACVFHVREGNVTRLVVYMDRDRALAAGCDDYDTKPVDFTRLVDKIEAQLTQRRDRSE